MPEPISTSSSVIPVDPFPRRRPVGGFPRAGAEPEADEKLKAACEDMEALFVHHMLSEMRKTVVKSGLIDGGRSEEIYTSLMDAELAKEMAHSGGLGLSAILKEQLSAPAGLLRNPARRR